MYGVECKGGDLLGGVPPSTKQTSGKCPNQIGASSQSLGNLFRKLVNFFRKGDYFFGNQINLFRNGSNLFRNPILTKALWGGEELSRSFLGLLSVVGRWNEARYKRTKRNVNLNKTHIL